MTRAIVCAGILTGILVSTAQGQDQIIFPPEWNVPAENQDLVISSARTIDLALATDGSWDDPGVDVDEDGLDDGVYDPDKWAVVFKYSSVTINSSKVLKFSNHRTRAPVVWLVDGDVDINSSGYIRLNGKNSSGGYTTTEPGPGGFRGGRDMLNSVNPGSGGFGPGGAEHIVGSYDGAGGSFATQGDSSATMLSGRIYGHESILPLSGGSGGSANANNGGLGGGAGGGAILIVASGTITINGNIEAKGGGSLSGYAGGGSGGAIRLIAGAVTGAGNLQATGGTNSRSGGNGYIRIEAVDDQAGSFDHSEPFTSISPPPDADADTAGIQPQLWLEDAPQLWPLSAEPKLIPSYIEYTDINTGQTETTPTITTDPNGSLVFPDVTLPAEGEITLFIEVENLPCDDLNRWDITVRVIPLAGTSIEDNMALAPTECNPALWTTSATFPIPDGISAIQLRADAPPP